MINKVDRAYQDLLTRVLNEGKLRGDRTGTGTVSIFSHTLEIDMGDGFPLLTTKKMFAKGIIHELLWFLNGDTNIKYLVENGVNIWTSDAYRMYLKNFTAPICPPNLDVQPSYYEPMSKEMFTASIKERGERGDEFAKRFGELGPIYGRQWVSWGNGINQIEQAIDKLNNNPEDRRIIVSAWNVGAIDDMALPPCHWAFELYTEEMTGRERLNISTNYGNKHDIRANWDVGDGYLHMVSDKFNVPRRKLHLKWHQRSVDVFLGLPFNIASYGLLLHMLAQQTDMVAGTLIGDLTNVHIYQNHIDQCKEQISREPLALPTIRLEMAKDIFSYSYDNIKFENYNSHGPIKGDISV